MALEGDDLELDSRLLVFLFIKVPVIQYMVWFKVQSCLNLNWTFRNTFSEVHVICGPVQGLETSEPEPDLSNAFSEVQSRV